MEKPVVLPAISGMSEHHTAASNELIGRIIALLSLGQLEVKSLIAREDRWSDRFEETVQLKIGDIDITVSMVTPKSK